MAHPHEAAFLDIIDVFLEEASVGHVTDMRHLDDIINTVLGKQVPAATEDEITDLKSEAMRYLMGAIRNAGLYGEMPGIPLTQVLDDGKTIRSQRVFSGVIAAVVYMGSKETLVPLEHWVLPFGEQTELETVIRETHGTSRDAVSVCTFPFQPHDYLQSGIGEILTQNLASGALRMEELDFDVPYRQCLLRRTPPSAIWQMPDGRLALPLLVPVTVMSLVAPEYWNPDSPADQEASNRMAEILAAGLDSREMLDCAVEVFGGHLHVGIEDVDKVVKEIVADLTGQGGRVRRYPYRTAGKVGRNLPCPCGSGLKYKKCCG